MKRILAAVASLLLVASAAAAAESWSVQAIPAQGLTVEAPAPLVPVGGDPDLISYQVSFDGLLYGISVGDFAGVVGADEAPPDTMVTAIMKGAQEEADRTVSPITPVDSPHGSAREAFFANGERLVRMRAIYRYPKVYMIGVSGDANSIDALRTPEVERFMDSVTPTP